MKKTGSLFIALAVVISVGAPLALVFSTAEGDGASEERQAAAKTEPKTDPRAVAVLDEAIAAMDEYDSLQAIIRTRVDMFGQKMQGGGMYLQKLLPENKKVHADFDRLVFRWELSIQSDPASEGNTTIRVRTQRYVWDFQRIQTPEGFEDLGPNRIDLEKVRIELENVGILPTMEFMNRLPEAGGLSLLFRDLSERMPPESIVDSELEGGFPVWEIRGRMSHKAGESLLGFEGADDTYAAYPEQAPTHVAIWIGKSDRFPHRVEFQRAVTAEDGSGVVRMKTLAMLEFINVEFNQPIADYHFHYSPGDRPPVDRTEDVTSRYVKK